MAYNAIEKALLVLSNFADGNTPIGTVELSERLELNKTTVNRIMNTLKKHDFLEQNPMTKQYSLGPKIAKLGKSILRSLEGQTTIIAQPYADRLRDEVGETVHIEVLSGNRTYLAYAARGPNPVSVSITVGDLTSPFSHAGAKSMAAFTSPEEVDKLLKSGVPSFSVRSLIDDWKNNSTYGVLIKQGVTIDDCEFDENIYAIAAPVFDTNCKAMAAVVVVAPFMRKKDLERNHVIERIKETASLISGRLHCPKLYEDICKIHIDRLLKEE